MIDLDTQLRAYFDAVDPPFDPEHLIREPLGETRVTRVRPGRGVAIAVATAIVVSLFVGIPLLLLALDRESEPARPENTTVPSTSSSIPGPTTTELSTTLPPEATEPGINWVTVDWGRVPDTAAVFAGEGTQYIEAITIGGPGFVAVGSDCSGPCPEIEDDGWDAAVWVSDDAVEWNRVSHDEAVFGGPGSQDMIDVVSAGPGLVAVGIIDHAYFGARRSPQEFRPGEMGVFGPSGRDDVDAAVWVSDDGVNWERVPDPDGVFSGPGDGSSVVAGDEAMEAIAVGNGLIVAVGSAHEDAAVWLSNDGLSWQRVPHDDEVFGGRSGQWMHDVIYTGERFVAVGTDLNGAEADDGGLMRGAVWTSEDGSTWLRVQQGDDVFGGDIDPFFIWTVTATDDGLIAAGTSPTKMALWASDDGLEWQRIFDESAPFAYLHTDIKVFPNTFQLRHAPVKALAGFGDRVLPVGWNRDAAQMLTPSTDDYHFEHDFVIGQLNTTEAKTDVVVAGGRAIAVGYANGDAAVWIADIND